MTGLGRLLRELIASEGPITLARYMSLALGHPTHGYYATRDPLGASGDFTTAPEISQMFGELLGLWAAAVWDGMGRPTLLRLVELGPGRGTLMADALRAAQVVPAFRAAVSVHLVETSPTLRARQRQALAAHDGPLDWHDGLEDVPAGPAIVLANEFADALPIRQFVRAEGGWRERLVGLGPSGELQWGIAGEPSPELAGLDGPDGAVLEISEERTRLASSLAGRLASEGGAALLIDYGHVRPGFGDTVQAVQGHSYVDPLDQPGESDLTAHVDFAALARAAQGAGALAHGPIEQGAFLGALGIEARAARLVEGSGEPGRDRVRAALDRLAGPGPDGMGELFKVLGLSHPGLRSLPGLPDPRLAWTRP